MYLKLRPDSTRIFAKTACTLPSQNISTRHCRQQATNVLRDNGKVTIFEKSCGNAVSNNVLAFGTLSQKLWRAPSSGKTSQQDIPNFQYKIFLSYIEQALFIANVKKSVLIIGEHYTYVVQYGRTSSQEYKVYFGTRDYWSTEYCGTRLLKYRILRHEFIGV